LLSSPAAGLDVRELSSHLLEHYVRHPASLVVRMLRGTTDRMLFLRHHA
jgi:hypothetical protein